MEQGAAGEAAYSPHSRSEAAVHSKLTPQEEAYLMMERRKLLGKLRKLPQQQQPALVASAPVAGVLAPRHGASGRANPLRFLIVSLHSQRDDGSSFALFVLLHDWRRLLRPLVFGE